MSNSSELFARAVHAYGNGQVQNAAETCRQILALEAQHVEAGYLLAVIELQAGRRDDGIRLLRAVIAHAPDHPFARLTLGTAQMQSGRPGEALEQFSKACELVPGHPEAHFQRGAALMCVERLDEALTAFECACRADPTHYNAWFGRGDALLRLTRLTEALTCYQQVLTLEPRHLPALINCGTALLGLGRAQEALSLFEQALQASPTYAKAHLGRGNALLSLGRLDQALQAFEQAARLDQSPAAAHCNRGRVLEELGRPLEALESLGHALRLDPRNTTALTNRGNLLLDLGRPAEALESFDRVLNIAPHSPNALSSRGCALLALRRPQEALADFERALQLDADFSAAHGNRACALMELERTDEALASFDRALQLLGAAGGESTRARPGMTASVTEVLDNNAEALARLKRFPEAAERYRRLAGIDPSYDYCLGNLLGCQLGNCDWKDLDEAIRQVVEATRAGRRAARPFTLLGITDSPEDQLRCAQLYTEHEYPPEPVAVWRGERYEHSRIRVAYLSGDFRDHVVSYLMAGVFEAHDRSHFEVFGIALTASDASATGERVRRSFEHFEEAGRRSDAELAARLRELEIDIAVDLSGYTGDCRAGIFARRAAPVQVNYLGFPGTMGSPYMDYIVADKFVIPPDDRRHYSEKVVYLPHCFQANDSSRQVAPAPTRQAAGLPERGFVFCSFNSPYKLNPTFFDIWCELLAAVPGSVLWLLGASASATENLRRAARQRGTDPSRLIFGPHLSYDAHLARLQLADLILDTLPFNAGATASNALWAGVPLLTCAGASFAGRMAGSLLHSLDLHELIAGSVSDYRDRALQLAQAPEELGALRTRLARNRFTYPLFSTQLVCSHLEAAFREMRRHSNAGGPQHIEVPTQ